MPDILIVVLVTAGLFTGVVLIAYVLKLTRQLCQIMDEQAAEYKALLIENARLRQELQRYKHPVSN